MVNFKKKSQFEKLFFLILEKIAELILKEDLFQIFLLYIRYLSESKIILFIFSICSNMLEYDTSMNHLFLSIYSKKKFFPIDFKNVNIWFPVIYYQKSEMK
jgi:hypothetical protein